MVDDGLRPLSDSGADWSARKVVRGLGLRDEPPDGRPRVVAAMIASADGRATLGERSVGLGNAADRALLRELRTAVDAILVGTGTLRAERYANLLDDDQRALRVATGLDEEPVVVTVSRRLDVPVEVPLFAEPDARVLIYTEAEDELAGRGAWVAVHRFAPGTLTLTGTLAHLRAERGVHTVLCEGGPKLLRRLAAERCLDDLLLTVAPMLVAGDGLSILAGEALDPPLALRLRDVLRADDHLVLHLVA